MTDHYDRMMLDYGFPAKAIRMMRFFECSNLNCSERTCPVKIGEVKLCQTCQLRLKNHKMYGYKEFTKPVYEVGIPDILTTEFRMVR